MAFHDWNRNGKDDIEDDLIEYHIIKNCMDNNSNGNAPRGCCSSCLVWVVGVVVLIIALVGAIVG